MDARERGDRFGVAPGVGDSATSPPSTRHGRRWCSAWRLEVGDRARDLIAREKERSEGYPQKVGFKCKYGIFPGGECRMQGFRRSVA
jgi:hypothetical protein